MILKRSLLFKWGGRGWEKVRNLPLSQSQHVANLGPEEVSLSLTSMHFPGNSVARLEILQPSYPPLPFADAWSFMIKTQALKAFICDKTQNSCYIFNERRSPKIRKVCVPGDTFPPFHNFVTGGCKSRGEGQDTSVAGVGVSYEQDEELHSSASQ